MAVAFAILVSAEPSECPVEFMHGQIGAGVPTAPATERDGRVRRVRIGLGERGSSSTSASSVFATACSDSSWATLARNGAGSASNASHCSVVIDGLSFGWRTRDLHVTVTDQHDLCRKFFEMDL